MPLSKLTFNPGINREITAYANEQGWRDCDKVRFRSGFPEKIGGWVKYSDNVVRGTVRSLYSWVALSGDIYLGVGTHKKFYIEEGETFNDITPIRKTTTNAATFAATNGSDEITVTDSGHGAVQGDFVTFSGAATLGGNVTAAVLNAEHEITTIVDSNSYKITLSVTANSSDTGNGGGSVTAQYQINIGLDSAVSGTGWGIGTWGRGTWGSATTGSGVAVTLGKWSQDNFGENLLINQRDGAVYYWVEDNGVGTRAVALSDLAGANKVVTVAKQILVSDRDRHVVAFGCDQEESAGTQDPLLIRFASQETVTDWETRTDNTAGSLKLGTGSEIVCAVETKQEILVWTDISLHSMRFLGPPFTFGISQISGLITIASSGAAIAVEDFAVWMGRQDFYIYRSGVQTLPCTVKEYVFSDMNTAQMQKITSGVNSAFSEVWWFYPSSSSNENDRYVIWNYQTQIWYIGNLSRTAWLDRGIKNQPIAAAGPTSSSSDQVYLFNHEVGLDDGSTDPASPITSFIESSSTSIGEGDKISFVRRIIPDLSFVASDSTDPSATLTLKGKDYPGDDFTQSESSDVTRTSTTPIEQYTDKADIRLRGRALSLRIESNTAGVKWRLGVPRIEIRPDGRR